MLNELTATKQQNTDNCQLLETSIVFFGFKQLRVLVCLLYVSFSLSGCVTAPSLPQWVSNGPDDSLTYYAVGEGVSLYDAEMNARSTMAASLNSTVSDYVQIYIASDGRYNREIYQQTTTVEVSNISLSQAHVTQQKKLGNRYFVLLAMLKSDLAIQLRNEIKTDARKVELALKNNPAESFLQWWKLRQNLSAAKRIARNISLLNQIKKKTYPSEDKLVEAYFTKLDISYGTRALAIKNKTNTATVYDMVSNKLEHHQIAVEKNLSWLNPIGLWTNPSYVEIRPEYQYQRIGQEYYVNGILSVSLKSSRDHVLSTFNLRAQGASYSGRKQALQIVNDDMFSQLDNINLMGHFVSHSIND